ncbi:MAG TPA: RNA 2'-phosphotransferase [Pyrinomonadaceae bacterium]|nr:RNA 2'-phosphotransferase [Pyrinomonadaceae bacterium]
MHSRLVRVSKFLSLVLRHQPERIGVELDGAGWVAVADLLAACGAHGFPLTREELEMVVRENDKQRFALSEDGARIRASQGHSVRVELGYAPRVPPAVLYHGTAAHLIASIKERGLVRGRRQHVHLSVDAATAMKVGARHGRPRVIEVESGRMHADGCEFYLSENGVWLTEHVPAKYLVFESD